MKRLCNATATPLASIFGSGFLIIVPVLSGAVGKYAVFAMIFVCALAYCVGEAIRHNIRVVEPLLAGDKPNERIVRLEAISDLAIVAAYVISVCLYANILSSFLLRGFGEQFATEENVRIVSFVVISSIGLIGVFHGLEMLQKLEVVGLCLTLIIVGALFWGFGRFDLAAAAEGIQWPPTPTHSMWRVMTLVGGTLIVVQGFETSRYLGHEFDSALRIRSSRLSQIISTAVYVSFVALATPLMHFLTLPVKDNDLIMLAGKASPLLPLPLVCAAVFSQFSAAVADTMGGGGNMVEATKGKVDSKQAYFIICAGAIALLSSPTLTIMTLASRAFAFYYLLQCRIAMLSSESSAKTTFYGVRVAVLGFITVFSVPAG